MLWVPSYVGVEGNERADEAAKAASRSSRVRSIEVGADDLKPSIGRIILAEWQLRWENEPDCALRRLRPNIGRWESSSRRSRIEEVALTRLRIGHCHITHSHHLAGSDRPVCNYCNAPLSVKHVLCPSDICEQLKVIKSRFFPNASLVDVLGDSATVGIREVLSYLQKIRFNIVYDPLV